MLCFAKLKPPNASFEHLYKVDLCLGEKYLRELLSNDVIRDFYFNGSLETFNVKWQQLIEDCNHLWQIVLTVNESKTALSSNLEWVVSMPKNISSFQLEIIVFHERAVECQDLDGSFLPIIIFITTSSESSLFDWSRSAMVLWRNWKMFSTSTSSIGWNSWSFSGAILRGASDTNGMKYVWLRSCLSEECHCWCSTSHRNSSCFSITFNTFSHHWSHGISHYRHRPMLTSSLSSRTFYTEKIDG